MTTTDEIIVREALGSNKTTAIQCKCGHCFICKKNKILDSAVEALDRMVAEKPASLPDCDICHKPQTQLGALHFSAPDKNGMCKKTHVCVGCDKPAQNDRTLPELPKGIAIFKIVLMETTKENYYYYPELVAENNICAAVLAALEKIK